MQRIALFGGGFDPIHFGHINLALEIKDAHNLDCVYFCPAYCSPHKIKDPPKASAQDRLLMVKEAIDGIDGFKIFEYEIQRKIPSFTIDTLREFVKKQDAKYFFIVSEDAIDTFDTWKNPDQILELASPLVGKRGRNQEYSLPKKWLEVFQRGMTNTRILEISSTEIRKRLFEKKYSGHLVPSKVLDYISNNNLY